MTAAEWLAFAPIMATLLAGVAGVSYILGRRSQTRRLREAVEELRERPAALASIEPEDVSHDVRRRLAIHHANIEQFRDRVGQLASGQHDPDWQLVMNEAGRVLAPTDALSDAIALAYNELRQQATCKAEPRGERQDTLTGLENRQTTERLISFLLALKARYDNVFSLVLVDIDNFADFNAEHGRAAGDGVLRELAAVIVDSMRDTDAAGRFDGEEFVIVLPETGLEGTGMFGERLRHRVEQTLPITISCGLATVADGDTAQTILSRADSALYSAKSAGQNCAFQHTGRSIHRVNREVTTHLVGRAVPIGEAAPASQVPIANS